MRSTKDARQEIDKIVAESSEKDWSEMAKTAGMSLDKFKENVVKTLESLGEPDEADINTGDEVAVTIGKPQTTTRTKDGDFTPCHDWDESDGLIIRLIPDAFEFHGTLQLCGTDALNWELSVRGCIKVGGSNAACIPDGAKPPHKIIEIKKDRFLRVNLGIVSLELSVDLKMDDKLELTFEGQRCHWWWGMHCRKFYSTPVSLDLPWNT